MQVKVIKDTWLPAQTALVEVDSPCDGLLVCTSERVDVWPRKLTKGINKVRCQIREERAPITLQIGEIIGEVVSVERDNNTGDTGNNGCKGKRKAVTNSDK